MYVCMYSTCLSVASLPVCMHACMYVFYLRSPGDHMCELALRLAARGAKVAIFDVNEKNQIEKRTVITKTVDSILREGIVVDFMSIDIEGNEMGVLNSIDFEKYEFRVICVENNIPQKQNFNEFLSKKGFCFFDRVGVDEIYYNKKYFDVFK